MRKIINNWHTVSIGLAAVSACIFLMGDWNATQKYLLASAVFLCLHFFEEFGFPGGFPYMGVKVLLGSAETDSSKWDVNNLNAMLSNWMALLLLYLLPLFIPGARFLLIGAIVLSIGEIIMHLLLFNIRLKQFYNPGLITGLFGIGTVVIIYLFTAFNPSMYVWYDYVLGILYFFASFFFCYRSPMYWSLGRIKGYPLSDRSAYGLEMRKITKA